MCGLAFFHSQQFQTSCGASGGPGPGNLIRGKGGSKGPSPELQWTVGPAGPKCNGSTFLKSPPNTRCNLLQALHRVRPTMSPAPRAQRQTTRGAPAQPQRDASHPTPMHCPVAPNPVRPDWSPTCPACLHAPQRRRPPPATPAPAALRSPSGYDSDCPSNATTSSAVGSSTTKLFWLYIRPTAPASGYTGSRAQGWCMSRW
mmetsp:Transcript_101757/g.172357  ORF Transcript_101757/g.172357 Transcript_101757/m.172357 type:complete len:201 (-) Transcript_101757:91-693(-)